MVSQKNVEVIPSASRLVRSLRDLGYDFVQAVADLVDNSIAAGATAVNVDITFQGSGSWLRVADNGHGMSRRELLEAMRFGSNRDYQQDDLGRFGLGLKTASLSQCRRLSVASRTDPSRHHIVAFAWDIDHLERTNRWEVQPLIGNALDEALKGPMQATTGTVVIWKRLDRILDYAQPNGEFARKRLSAMCRELEAHLAMVFHRFLAGEVRGHKLRILLNGNPVQPWDPFARDEPRTKQLEPVTIAVEQDSIHGEIVVDRFVLPQQSGFSTPEAFRRATGPANWNQQQGFYIYRAHRLLQAGGWCGLRTVDEHIKLARVALNFSPKLDAAFHVNVAKMRVQLPAMSREPIREALQPVIRLAQERYRHSTDGYQDNGSPQDRSRPSRTRRWTIDEFEQDLLRAARPTEKPVIKKVVERLRRQS